MINLAVGMKEEEHPTFTYLAICRFKPVTEEERLFIRPAHRAFIRQYAQIITWGGLMEKEEHAYGYCLLIHAENITKAKDLLGKDPYFAILEQSEVYNFLQRVPL